MIVFLKPIFYIIGLTIKIFKIPTKQNGFKIKFPNFMNTWELGCTIISKYEKDERELINKHLKNNDSVLELGACIGVVSLTINKILNDKTKQVSVEPNPQMLQYLIENKNNNNGCFKIETCIVSTFDKVDFHLGGKAFLSSSTINGGRKVEIPGKTLDEMIEQHFPFTAIVMDIEGGELDFFRSFDLKNSDVRLIIWETHMKPNMLSQDELQECYDILTKQGFNFTEKSGEVEAWSRILVTKNIL